MNNDLISREALKKAYFNAINETSIGEVSIIDIIDNAPAVEQKQHESIVAQVNFDKEQLQQIVDEAKAEVLESLAKEHKWYECITGSLLKARHNDYVLYRVDYLLEHLAREITLLEQTKKLKWGNDNG